MKVWAGSLRAALAGFGAYCIVSAVVLILLVPFEYRVPLVGTIAYPPLLPILIVASALGIAAAASFAYASGGYRAVMVIAVAWGASTVYAIAPYVRAGPTAWIPPNDIKGLMPSTVLAISEIVALPAAALGVGVGSRWRPAGAPSDVLLAAGAYAATCLGMSLPTPQLDFRLALPFTAAAFPDVLHAAVLAVPAAIAGVMLGRPGRPVRRIAAIAAGIGFLGAAPMEIPVTFGTIQPYWPLSLTGVPLETAAVAVVAAFARRAVEASSWSHVRPAPLTAAASGSAVALSAVGAWMLLAGLPSIADRNVRIDAFSRTGDERKIVACVTSGRGEQLAGSSAREDRASVAVTIKLRRPPSWEFSDLVGIELPIVVVLDHPLANRTVIDATTGDEVREVVRSPPSPAWC